MSKPKWWDNPTAAVGALMGEKARKEADERLKEKLQAEYERGLQEGKESAVVHAHWIDRDHGYQMCSNCYAECEEEDDIPFNAYSHCPWCGAKMDEDVLK